MSDTAVWRGKTVLIVEDSLLVQKDVAHAFTQLGLQVVGFASHGLEGLDKFQELKPDLVSLDIIMPHMHGIDCYRKLLALEPRLKAVFISSLAADPKICQAFPDLIAPSLFLEKPVSLDKLRASLQVVFEQPASQAVP